METMIEINDAAVRLAKKVAETDGFERQLEFKLPLPPDAKPAINASLDDAARERYRTLARQQGGAGVADAVRVARRMVDMLRS